MIVNESLTVRQADPAPLLFQNLNILIFFYMVVLLVVSNLATCTFRAYRRSLSYIRINIIILLNGFLVETFNSIVFTLVVLIFLKGL